jgi:hypothetical protein
MSKQQLTSLVIENLRGSVAPFTFTFEKGKKLSIVFGENGTGKTTICDALDFLGNGNVGSLDDRGLGKTGKYWHTVGRTPGDVSVKLETTGGNCSATLTKSGVVVNPSNMQPKVKVLRRNQILNLVAAKASERYNAISQFIDVSGVETSETSLRQLIRDIEKKIEVAVAVVQEGRETIERFWEQAGRLGQTALEWAAEEIVKDQSALDTTRIAIESLKASFNRLFSYPEQYKSQLALCTNADEAITAAQKTVNDLNGQVAGEYVEILEILQAAQRHFTHHPQPQVCPLCESNENVAGLSEKVTSRIASQTIANQLKTAKANLATKQQSLEAQNQRLEELIEKALTGAGQFVTASSNESLPNDIVLPSLPFPTDLAHWKEWLNTSSQLLEKWGEISDSCAENKKFISMLKASLEALQQNSEVQHELDELVPRLKEALAVVESERKKFTDNILKNIATEVGRLYEVVHPGEGLNKISLELDPAKRASLEIATEFQGQNGTPPQAYFSDSHLDTLGLCIFLALAQKEKPDETILVLDDVLGSVDEPHVERLIEMIYSEALKFRQCLITSHYKPWKQKLRWGWLKTGQCQFVELNKWTSASGITLIRSIPDIERLSSLLAETPPDPQLVCAKAGVILEAALDFLTLLYECDVPRRAHALYTLGDLLPAIDKKLRAVLRVEHKQEKPDGTIFYVDKHLAPHLNELIRIMQARNIFGCHFNALSFELLDADAIAFGTEVLALIDCLVDHEIGWPRSDKSGSYWATSGETRRLHPLKKPS